MKSLKIESLSSELKEKIKIAQLEYLKAKAKLEACELIEYENKTFILANNILKNEHGQRVLSANSDYLLNDEDFNKFLELLFIENKKAGLPVTDKDEAIDYKFKKEVIKREKELFKLQLETVPSEYKKDIETIQNHYKYKEKALELILNLGFTAQAVQ